MSEPWLDSPQAQVISKVFPCFGGGVLVFPYFRGNRSPAFGPRVHVSRPLRVPVETLSLAQGISKESMAQSSDTSLTCAASKAAQAQR